MCAEVAYQPSINRILHLLTVERRLAYAQISPDLVVQDVSPNLRESLADPQFEDEIKGQPLSRLFWEFIGAEEMLSAVVEGSSTGFTIENVNRPQPDGSLRYLTFQVAPLNGTIPEPGLLLIVEDNTTIATLQQKLIQERNALRLSQYRLLQANDALTRLDRMKSMFLSIAAHDLRVPLTGIRGAADLIRSAIVQGDSDPGETLEFASEIITQTDNLNRLITDILDLDQIEQGKLTVHPMQCDLESLAREVCEVMAPVDEVRYDLQLNFEEAGTPVLIWADPDRIRQILYNLIGNALKYTPPPGLVRVSCWKEETCGAVSIADNGRGIAEEDLDRIFALYYRTEEAMRKQARGVGLGLYIVKHLVDAMGGSIAVSSQPNQGATFIVRLPCRDPLSTGA